MKSLCLHFIYLLFGSFPFFHAQPNLQNFDLVLMYVNDVIKWQLTPTYRERYQNLHD